MVAGSAQPAPHPVAAALDALGARLVLASGSPRRHDLLTRVGVVPVVVPADVDESVHPGEDPVALVERLARHKAVVVARAQTAPAVVVAGDTEVARDGVVLGKPRDRDHARAMLEALSGRSHEVHSGIAVAWAPGGPGPHGAAAGPTVHSVVATTVVTLTPLTEADLAWYLDLGEWRGKAGAYALQGAGAAFVTDLSGLDTTVVGLPLAPTLALLAAVVGGRIDSESPA